MAEIGQNPPPEGWEGPDERGFMKYTMHGGSGNTEPPEVSGMECFFVAVVGHYYTRWTYRPVPAPEPEVDRLDAEIARLRGMGIPDWQIILNVADPRYTFPDGMHAELVREPVASPNHECMAEGVNGPAPSPTRGTIDPGYHPSGEVMDILLGIRHSPEQVRDRISDSDPREDALIALAEVEDAREAYRQFKDSWARAGDALKKLDRQAWHRIGAYPGWEGTAEMGSGNSMDDWMDEAEQALRAVYEPADTGHSECCG